MHQEELVSVKLRNININLLINLINQSLIVSPQLMFEFSPNLIKSVNFSSSDTFMKIWIIEIQKLLKSKKEELNEIESLDIESNIDNQDEFESYTTDFNKTFNFYLLRGEQFKNVLNIFKNDTIDIEFFLLENDGEYHAKSLIINGFSENDRPLKTEFVLTFEEMITNKISDYNKILDHCKPKPDMVEISFTDTNIKELKKLISTLHKTMANNYSFVTFKINENHVKINDKVFDITFDDIKVLNLTEDLEFNMLKSDFQLIGNQSFKLYTAYDTKDLHIGASYNNAIIYCITAKATTSEDVLNSLDDEDVLSASDLLAYDLDDM